MINATKELLNPFFSGGVQYIIPFFQRSYVWTEENWETLWEHVYKVANSNGTNSRKEHFIGTLITKQRDSTVLGEQKLDLIDGQQRLTTFSLLLKAIAAKASGNEPYVMLKAKTNELVVFFDSRGKRFIRIEHSRNDKEYFEAVMLDKNIDELPNQNHKVLKCYRFFLQKLEEFDDEMLFNVQSAILNNVPVISMLLASTDDEQEIFDTINSLGVRLTTGELLKNYIFSDENVRPYFNDLWESIFEDDESQIDFWNKPKTAGRTIRSNVEVLLYCYLIIQKKSAIELERLFKEYKSWLDQKTSLGKIEFLQELKGYAKIFYDFPDGTELNEISFSQSEKRFFHVVENLEITTVFPLILYIYKSVSDRKEREEMLLAIESYLVRRNVCRLTAKNYNNLFIQIISKLSESEIVSAEKLNGILFGFSEDSNRRPTDDEFSNAFLFEPHNNSNTREILYCIALFQVYNPKNDVTKLSSSSYSTEHILPQKWEKHWQTDGMSDAAKSNRNRALRTYGNLTLVTKCLNSSMRNGPWEIKKEALSKYSMLKMTTDYLAKSIWNESEIASRANDLATLALKIWK